MLHVMTEPFLGCNQEILFDSIARAQPEAESRRIHLCLTCPLQAECLWPRGGEKESVGKLAQGRLIRQPAAALVEARACLAVC